MIETIDFRSLGTPKTQTLLRQVCCESGFFALSNHGLDDASRQNFLARTEHFFSMPSTEKLKLERTADNPFGFYDKELTKNQPDWKEVFDISLSPKTPTHWPDDSTFVETMHDWSTACHQVALELLDAVFASLGITLEREFFLPEHTSFLRLNYYPPCPNPANENAEGEAAGAFGVSHHTDAGALTLLQQDGTTGLQFWKDNQWLTATADPTVLLVNLGDMLQVWTNDEYKAPLHRVLANSKASRLSAPYFLNPSYDCDCMPLNSGKPRYRTINWGEFRRRRADGDYADYGSEVQISDYRL